MVLEDLLLGPDVIFKQSCQFGQMLFHLPDVMPKFLLNIFYDAESSFQTISHISIPRK